MLVVHAASTLRTLNLFVEQPSSALAAKGYRFLFVTGEESPPDKSPYPTFFVPLHRGYGFFLAWFSSRNTLRKLLSLKPDVFHVHTPATALGLMWVLRGLARQGVRLVYTARGGFDEGRRAPTRILWQCLDPLRWRLWDAIGVVNNHLFQKAQRQRSRAEISLLSLGGASLNLSPSPIQARVWHNSSVRRALRLVWVGRFSRDKRPGDFLQLIALLRSDYGLAVQGVVIGDGDHVDRAQLNADRALGIERLGWVPCPQKHLVDCDLLVSTSVREGYGLVPVEAALVGTPTIAYATYGTSKSVSEVGGRIVPRCDLKALSQAVLEWVRLSDSDKGLLRQGVLERSRELVGNVSIVSEMESLYRPKS